MKKNIHKRRSTLEVYSVIISMAFISWSFNLFGQDGHIDPSPIAHIHNLSFARHVNSTFNGTTASQGLQFGTNILQKCDSRVSADQDVSCQVTIQMSGSLGMFGTATDGLDVITTLEERKAAIENTSAYVKVVTAIMVRSDGTPGTVLGFANTPGSSIVMVNYQNTENTGKTLVHEFGHNKGLAGHRDSPGNPIMGTTLSGPFNEVNQAECAAFHLGGTDNGPNRPVDVAFIIDDTGSMWEEIAGVRNSLLTHLGTYCSNCCNAFQLTTFKDYVSERIPTTDLSLIQSQVSALVATGGGDCPESSVEAISQVSDNIKDNGRAFVATDAAPHSGLDIDDAINNLRALGIRVDIVLTGDCPNFSASPLVAGGSSHQFSENNDNGKASSFFDDPSISTEITNYNAIEAFSLMAQKTGGIFAFVPEVNYGGSSDIQRFENTIFNIVQGGLTESIALAQPANGPAGGTMVVALTGASTNFKTGTSLTFEGGGISLTNLNVISPIKLEVTIEIAPGASLGFRDITAVTDLGGGVIETAQGVGVFEVVSAPLNPTIIGISPPSGEAGQSLSVTVNGINTNFTNSSVLDMGSDITILNVNAISGQLLEANIDISEVAMVGFRDVTVTTGGELATENMTGPFFVSTALPAEPEITSVTPNSGAPGREITIEIVGQNTSFTSGVSTLSFSGTGVDVLSTSITSATTISAFVQISSNADPGFRDVRVTTGAEIAVFLDGFLVTESSPGTYDIYEVNVKSGNVERVTQIDDADEYNPSFSNNGKKLVHDVKGGSAPLGHSIYITDIKSGISTPLDGADGGNDASWSPNGRYIAFDRTPVGDQSIYVVPASGGTRKLVRANSADAEWSNNSQRLVFQDISDNSIRTVDIKGGTETLVADFGVNPSWSPNGKAIAFSDGNNIFTVAVNQAGEAQGSPIQVTNDGANVNNQQPSWSNNSKTIVFHSNRESGDFDVWTVSAFGGTPTLLTGDADNGDYDPCYSKNGRYVAYAGFTNTISSTAPLALITTGTGEEASNAESTVQIPETFSLEQNYPNPFNPTTTIQFGLPEAGLVNLKIFNIQGQLVRSLVSGYYDTGIHQVQWDSKNDYGEKVASGFYFYSLRSQDFYQIKRMLLG
jgi:Tol biopolymer transport system component